MDVIGFIAAIVVTLIFAKILWKGNGDRSKRPKLPAPLMKSIRPPPAPGRNCYMINSKEKGQDTEMEATWENVGKVVDETIQFLSQRFEKMYVYLGAEDKDNLAEELYAAIHAGQFNRAFEGEAYSE